jgi:heat shock protein HtpX
MCVDNPRTGFGELFDTHPPIDKRIEALIKFAGGRDPGPLALPAPTESDTDTAEAQTAGPWGDAGDQPASSAPAGGPWGNQAGQDVTPGGKPFLPAQPPIELGQPSSGSGPWGPRRGD